MRTCLIETSSLPKDMSEPSLQLKLDVQSPATGEVVPSRLALTTSDVDTLIYGACFLFALVSFQALPGCTSLFDALLCAVVLYYPPLPSPLLSRIEASLSSDAEASSMSRWTGIELR